MMDIKLLTFGEALEKLKQGENLILIRSKDLSADFQLNAILLYNCKKYIYLKKGEGLWKARRNETDDGFIHSMTLDIRSEELLAEDYIDTSNWVVVKNKNEYKELLEKDTRPNLYK